jgi:hypothetical protein
MKSFVKRGISWILLFAVEKKSLVRQGSRINPAMNCGEPCEQVNAVNK